MRQAGLHRYLFTLVNMFINSHPLTPARGVVLGLWEEFRKKRKGTFLTVDGLSFTPPSGNLAVKVGKLGRTSNFGILRMWGRIYG